MATSRPPGPDRRTNLEHRHVERPGRYRALRRSDAFDSILAGRSLAHDDTPLGDPPSARPSGRSESESSTAVAIATGPGAFTGLRVGFGVAKGFHLATGVPLIGIPTLEATALGFAICGIPVVAVVGAGRGRLVWARYDVER